MSVARAWILLGASLTISPLLGAQQAPQISLPPGDAVRGKAVFESSKNNCLGCHRVSGRGSLFGPELTTIAAPPRGGAGPTGRGAAAAPGGARGPAPAAPVNAANQTQQFAQSILDPNAVVSVQNRYVQLKMKDGKTSTGKLLNIDTFAIQIFDSNEKLVNVSRTDVREMTMTSPMPSYRDKLTNQEVADVVAYLMTLKAQ
jgi:putative heme-binding domain-containing protein